MTISKEEEKTLPVPTSVIPIGKIIELRNRQLSYAQIAKHLGCSKANIIERLKPYKASIDHLQAVKDNRADVFAVYGSGIMESLTYEDVQKMSGLQKITGMGILYDKERLERDKSTKILAFKDLQSDHDSIVKERKALALELGYDSPDGPGDIDDTGPIMAEPDDD